MSTPDSNTTTRPSLNEMWTEAKRTQIERDGNWQQIFYKSGWAMAFHRHTRCEFYKEDLIENGGKSPSSAEERDETPPLTSANEPESLCRNPFSLAETKTQKPRSREKILAEMAENDPFSATPNGALTTLTSANEPESLLTMGRPIVSIDSDPSAKRAGEESNTCFKRAPQGRSKSLADAPPERPTLRLPESNFDQFESLRVLRDGGETLTIAYDSEWWGEPRRPLSYQFAVMQDGILHEFVILNLHKDPFKGLTLQFCLGVVLNRLGLRSYRRERYLRNRVCIGFTGNGEPEWEDSMRKDDLFMMSHKIHPLMAKEVDGRVTWLPSPLTVDEAHDAGEINKYERVGKRGDKWRWSIKKPVFPKEAWTKVQLVCHTGRVDLTLFDKPKNASGEEDWDGWSNLLRYVTDIQGGTMSLRPTRRYALDSHNVHDHHVFPVSLSVRDTMGHAPAGKKSLAALGKAIRLPKLEDGLIRKDDMYWTLENHPSLFFEYASRDSVVTLLYFTSLYGENRSGQVSATGAAAKVVKKTMGTYLGCGIDERFDRVFRGLERRVKGTVPDPRKAGFIEESNLEPISRKVAEIQQYGSQAFRGGFNASSRIGWYPAPTCDFDLQGAYPTAMAVVPDIDWEDPIHHEFNHHEMRLSDFSLPVIGEYPLLPMVGYFRFEFPPDTRFPSLIVDCDGVPIFPLTSEGVDGVYACGPEVFVALKLGAKVFCERGFVLNTLCHSDGSESRSLAHGVKRLLKDRALAKELFGKGSLVEMFLKLLANAVYGKVAQNVVPKQTWSTFAKAMETLGASAITNPISAALTTSIVRAELIAIMNQLEGLGYEVYSVTTDGFITNASQDVVDSLDMMGFKRFMEESRSFLTDGESRDIWEAKHEHTKPILNLTTRGNVAVELGGVLAHNSTRSPFSPEDFDTHDEYERADRDWLIKQCLSRKDPVAYCVPEWPSLKDLAQGKPFVIKNVTRRVRMDFDLKRAVDWDSIKDVVVEYDGEQYTIANFNTRPYHTVDDARRAREKRKSVAVLRTKADWELYRLKLSTAGKGFRIEDPDFAVLMSCIRGHRQGLWVIEELDDPTKSVKEKVDWINAQDLSPDKEFTESHWKNCAPSKRRGVLPVEELVDALDVLGAKFVREI